MLMSYINLKAIGYRKGYRFTLYLLVLV